MILVLIFGAAARAFLGLRPFRVLVLAPVILLVAAGAMANGIASGHDPRTVVFGLLAAVTSPQISYFVAAIAAQYLRPWSIGWSPTRAIGWSPTLLHAMQMTIWQELRTLYELPRELASEMVALLAQMK